MMEVDQALGAGGQLNQARPPAVTLKLGIVHELQGGLPASARAVRALLPGRHADRAVAAVVQVEKDARSGSGTPCSPEPDDPCRAARTVPHRARRGQPAASRIRVLARRPDPLARDRCRQRHRRSAATRARPEAGDPGMTASTVPCSWAPRSVSTATRSIRPCRRRCSRSASTSTCGCRPRLGPACRSPPRALRRHHVRARRRLRGDDRRAPGDTSPVSLFDGQIGALEPEFTEREAILAVRAYDRSHTLHRTKRTDTYQEMSYGDIAQAVAQRNGLTAGTIEARRRRRSFVQQSNETDWGSSGASPTRSASRSASLLANCTSVPRPRRRMPAHRSSSPGARHCSTSGPA